MPRIEPSAKVSLYPYVLQPPAIPPMPQMGPIIPQQPLAPSPVPGAIAPGVVAPPAQTYTSANTVHWVVSPEERKRCEARFTLADKDRDGFVSGVEIKDIFLQSGLSQPILAHIW
jgi:epidermal growth factor receptor substrate 15